MTSIRKMPVAKVGEILPGRTKSFRYGFQNGIAYNDAGVIKAYVNFCTHAGGSVELISNGVFRCRFHGAEFRPSDGVRLSGQAPEGTRLKPIVLIEENGEIFALLELKDEFEF